MVHSGVLGKDYVTLKGRGCRDSQNGATSTKDKFTHLSVDCGQSLICGGASDSFMLTYADVDIDCPKCVAKLTGG